MLQPKALNVRPSYGWLADWLATNICSLASSTWRKKRKKEEGEEDDDDDEEEVKSVFLFCSEFRRCVGEREGEAVYIEKKRRKKTEKKKLAIDVRTYSS